MLNQINGRDSNNTVDAPVPAIFGLDFQVFCLFGPNIGLIISVTMDVSEAACLRVQVLSVAQEKYGYADAKGTPTPQVLNALQDVDGAIGTFVAALSSQGLLNKTAVIVTAKHCQVRALSRARTLYSRFFPNEFLSGADLNSILSAWVNTRSSCS